jgi:PAS domain S-box-containing protein
MTITSTERHDAQGPEMPAHAHMVQFSENDASLISAVSAFISAGLRAGDACIIVATASHRESLEHHLRADGLDVASAHAAGSYLSLDAAATLAHFLVDGEPESTRFVEVIEPLIEQAAQGSRHVRIFGEMVALLWAEGNRTAATRLEDLWNELGQTHAFSLFCAYPMQNFGGSAHEAQFSQICKQHSQVVLPESYTQLSEQERLRAFALLQQKAHSLEIEIAERKAAQARLRVLAAIVESSDDAILSKDLDGIITSWNSAAERIYGYSAEEMIGQSVTRLFPPDNLEEFEQIMGRIRRGESVAHHVTRRMRKDGTILTVSVTISLVKDETGRISGASTIARDITEQRRLEAKSQQLFASNLIGIFVADSAGRLLEANQAFLDLVGYTREEWQAGALAPDAPTSSVAPFLRPLVLQARQGTGASDPQETVLPQKGGTHLPVLVAVTCLEDSETCIGFVLDITERKALEQRKDAFIGMASHELKTPVTSLKGFLSLVQRLLAQEGNAKALHYLTRMDAQIEKLIKLINDLLDVSRIQTGQLVYREERVAVDGLVQDIVEGVQETTQTHHLQLEGQTQAEVFGDRDRLGQVLINLLTNAIKYSPDADTVIVRLTTEADKVLVSVQDFGRGIAKAHHRKIFERFYQVTDPDEKTYPGLGVGEGPMIARVIEVVMRTDEDIYVSRLHAYLGQLFNHVAPQFYLRPRRVRRGLEVRGQAAVNQNIAAIAGLNEIADSRYFHWTPTQGRNLHEVKPLRPSCASGSASN